MWIFQNLSENDIGSFDFCPRLYCYLNPVNGFRIENWKNVLKKGGDLMKKGFRLWIAAFALCALWLGLAVGSALAQDYPNKPIRIIAPIAPGGSVDTAARIIADKLGPILGQPVLVENRPGASNRIGSDLVAKAAPDGYTILWVSNTHSIAPSMFKKMPYDAVKDFAPITLGASSPNFLVVHPSIPAKSVAELVKLAKSKPGKLNYGVSGLGEMPHLNGELFKGIAGIDIMVVPFKGSSLAVTALLGGHVDMAFGSVASLIPHIKAGAVRALAITSAKRSQLAPDVPTMVESGYPDFVSVTWNVVLAPAGTPKPIITKLNTEIIKVMRMPDVIERLAGAGLEPDPTTPEETADIIKKEIVRWGKVVKDAGIEPQ